VAAVYSSGSSGSSGSNVGISGSVYEEAWTKSFCMQETHQPACMPLQKMTPEN